MSRESNRPSLSDDGELMLSLLASFAQEEVRSLSENVKWGTRKRMQQGIPNGHFRVYGYRWEGDVLVPIPEEAAIVRRIFQNFLDGKSRFETEREFAAEGITTREGCRWVDSNIKVVLTNVTYTGSLLLQKDCWTPEYRAEASAYRRNHAPNRSGVTCFTTKIKCAVCGNNLNHKTQHSPTAPDGKAHYWRCPRPTECGVRRIRDDRLREVSAEVLGLPAFDEAAFLEQVDRIEVDAGTVVTFILKDGSRVERKWDTRRPPSKWSEERRARFEAQPKRTYSPERRQRMSERMKQLR